MFTNLIVRMLLFIFTLFNTQMIFAYQNSGKPLPPFRIVDNLYYVGNTYVASYLIVTPKGNVLINSNFKSDVPMIESNIKKLGFKVKDTKILLINHAHVDHAAGSAQLLHDTGAKYMVMNADVDVVETGGKADFQYGSSNDPDNFYKPVKVDRILHDGDKVKLGDTELVAHLTAGHTKGCTTWTMKATENGKKYNVVIVGGPYLNPGYKLVNNEKYPNIANDYKNTFAVMKSLPVDIFLGAHGLYFDLDKKYKLMKEGKDNVFVDPQGYMAFTHMKEKDFLDELERQNNNGRGQA